MEGGKDGRKGERGRSEGVMDGKGGGGGGWIYIVQKLTSRNFCSCKCRNTVIL